MDLSEIVAITGLPGLFKIAGRKNDGVIATSLVDNKTQFVPARTHLSTPLDKITIYTTDDNIELKAVLASIKKHEGTNKLPDLTKEADLKKWMEKVLPTYDKEKVHVSDMKKLAKWYTILNDKKLIEELTSDKPAEEENKEEGSTEKKDVAPKKESKPKTTKSSASTKTKGPKQSGAVKKITTPRKAS